MNELREKISNGFVPYTNVNLLSHVQLLFYLIFLIYVVTVSFFQSDIDNCKFCGTKLNPANLGLDFKTGAVTFIRCHKCKEITASGETKREM